MFKKRCVIIDVDQKFITIARSVIDLSEKFHFVNAYDSCEDGLRGLKSDLPDIVLMDVDFPGMKGAEAVTEIKFKYPHVEILIVSDYTDDHILFEVLSAGATGYILKRNCIAHLESYLLDISSGKSPMNPFLTRKLISNIHANRFSPLTMRETEVLKAIAHGKSYSSIATDLGISSQTSKTHIKNIYRKLKVNTKSEAVTKAITEKFIVLNAVEQT